MKSLFASIIFFFIFFKWSFGDEIKFPPPAQMNFRFELTARFRYSMIAYSNKEYLGPLQSPPAMIYFDWKKQKYFSRGISSRTTCDHLTELPANKFQSMLKRGRSTTGDGSHRVVGTINGFSPGKPLVVNQGAQVSVIIHNELFMKGLTLHFHGQHQKGNWFMDGVAGLQQCAVPYGSTFEYRFNATEAGTHWFHGHFGADRSEGLYGALIVVPREESLRKPQQFRYVQVERNPVYPIKSTNTVRPVKQFVLALEEWFTGGATEVYHQTVGLTTKFFDILEEPPKSDGCFVHTRNYDGTTSTTYPVQSILINGKGWFNQETLKNHPEKLPLQKYRLKAGKFYLFRLIHAGQQASFKISFEGHKLHVVATDGTPIEDEVVDSIMMMSGERYDFGVFANRIPGIYKLRVETLERYNDYLNGTLEPSFGLAMIEIVGRRSHDYQTDNQEDYDTSENNVEQSNNMQGSINSHFELFPTNRLSQISAMNRPRSGKWAITQEVEKCGTSMVTLSWVGQANPCKVLNCPFKQFARKENAKCIHLSKLRSFNPPQYPEVLAGIYRPHAFDDEIQEFFLNIVQWERVNGWRYRNPKSPPYLHPGREHQILRPCDGRACARVDDCNCFHHINITLGKTVQIVFYNLGKGGGRMDGASHPMHIHGHNFYIVKQGWGNYDETTGFLNSGNKDMNCADGRICYDRSWTDRSWRGGRIPDLNLIRPVLKDTVTLAPGGYVVIRFKADNPGWWFAHCHIMIHNAFGMAFAIREGTQEQMPKPRGNFPTCGNFYRDD